MERIVVDLAELFHVGESIRWKNNCHFKSNDLAVTENKWYDGRVHLVMPSFILVSIIADDGNTVNVPYFQYGSISDFADIELADPKLQQSRLLNYLSLSQDKLKEEYRRKEQIIKEQYQSLMNTDFAEWFKSNKDKV